MMGLQPIIIKSNGPLGRDMGAPGPENDSKQFTAVHFLIFVSSRKRIQAKK
jgi:hypothetical protein